MKMPFPRSLSCSLSFFAAGVASLSAGVVYQFEEVRPDQSGASTVEVKAEDQLMKMAYSGDTESQGWVIFNASEKTMTVGDPEDESYVVLTQETLESMSEAMRQVQQRMEQALQQVPEAQREQMRNMMQERMGVVGSSEPQDRSVEVEPTGESQEIAGYSTEGYTVKIAGNRQAELWVAPWSEIEGSDAVRQSFTQMASMFTELLETMPQAADSAEAVRTGWMRVVEEIGGFPVRSISYDAQGNEISRTTLQSIEQSDIAQSEFQPPAGWRQQSLEMPGMGRG